MEEKQVRPQAVAGAKGRLQGFVKKLAGAVPRRDGQGQRKVCRRRRALCALTLLFLHTA